MPNNPFVLPKGIASADGDAVAASQTDIVGTLNTGLLANVDNAEEAFKRLDNTGLGAQPRTWTGNFFGATYGTLGNQDIWYGGRQTVVLETDRSQTQNRQYIFEVPDLSELGSMFDDLASRGLGEIYTLRLTHRAGSSNSIVRNSLLVRTSFGINASGFQPTTIAQGQSVTYRIERINGIIMTWERVGIQQAVDPVATFGEVVLQNTGWNNANNSFLPPASAVQKGYAFPVIGSTPNDGTLRQGLLDAGVSDRVIYNGDYVVWTADAFTNWTNGDDWFVLSRNDLQRMSREQANFLAQTTEIDNRVDLGPVNALGGEGVVWLSENPLAEAPFINPSTDTNNPRSGDNYPYIGGRENRDFLSRFTFGQNRFNSYLTVGVSPSFVAAHGAENIFIRVRDEDNNLIQSFNLDTDFTFVDDGTFTNSTYRHYKRDTSFNYAFLTTIEVVLTQVQQHFRMDANTVDATQNIRNLSESQLDAGVQEKLNRAIPPAGVSYNDIEDRLLTEGTVSSSEPDISVRYLNTDGTSAYPQTLAGFNQVSVDNPRFIGNNVALFLATPEPGVFVLRNITANSVTPLAQSTPNVDVVESISDGGTTYFVWVVTGLTSGHVYEVDRTTTHSVIVERNDITNLKANVQRIDAELGHAVLGLSDDVVHYLENEVSVDEETTPVEVPTAYNNGLGDTNAQTVFREASPNTGSSGTLASNPIATSTGDRVQRKLLYIPADTTYGNSNYVWAHNDDTNTNIDLIDYAEGIFRAKVFVPATTASTTSQTIYPAPATSVSGPGIWHNIPTLTFRNGVPVPEADELFFTRNVPTSPTTLNIQYRGHANGNIFGTSSVSLPNVGGSTDAITTFTLDDGSESAIVEVWYRASTRSIRVSVTEQVRTGLPTINDIEVILSYDETRTIPTVPATTRNVDLERVSEGLDQVFAFKPSSTGTLIIVGGLREVDTGYLYTDLFSADQSGQLIVASENATFLDYEDFDPIASTIIDLENHSTLPKFGLFTTTYTHNTTLELDTQLEVRNSQNDVVNVGEELVLVASDNTRWRLSVDTSGSLQTTQVT